MCIIACIPLGTAKRKEIAMEAGAYNDLTKTPSDVHQGVYPFSLKV